LVDISSNSFKCTGFLNSFANCVKGLDFFIILILANFFNDLNLIGFHLFKKTLSRVVSSDQFFIVNELHAV